MKLLVDARMVGPQMHGISRYTVDLLKGLRTLGPRVTILVHDRAAALAHVPDDCFTDVVVAKSRFATGFDSLELSRLVKSLDFDVAHFPSFSVPVSLPHGAVVTIHDMIHLHKPSLAHWAYYNGVLKRTLKGCKNIIAVSEWTKGELQKYLEIPPSHVTVIRNGLDGRWFAREKDLPLPTRFDQPYFLCVSNLKAHKNVTMLIRACEQLWSHGHQFSLVLALGGQNLPSRLKLSGSSLKRIKILKNVSDQELKAYMQNCKALVSPSLAEGFDYPAAEALALGCQVILSGGSSHDEFTGNKLDFYRPAENMPALASTLLQILKTEDRDQAIEHNVQGLQAMADKTYEVYLRSMKAQ